MSIALSRGHTTTTTAVEAALDDLQAGRPVLAVDDLCGSGIEMMILANTASVHSVAEMIREGSGFICVTVTEFDARRLCLPPMTWESAPSFGGRMCVAVDAVDGTTTGISAHDRAITLRALGSPLATPTSFTRPGHVVPVLVGSTGLPDRTRLIAQAGQLCAERAGDAGGWPVAFTSLVSREDPCRNADITEAWQWGLPTIRYSDLLATLANTRRDAA